MKAKYDFGYIKQDERENISLFLSSFFKNKVSITNNIRKINFQEQKRFFKVNNVLFSISFPQGISLEEEKFLFFCMNEWQKEGFNIKKISTYISLFPIFEEEFILNGRSYFFACPEKVSLSGKSNLDNFNELLDLKIKLKTKIFCDEITKISKSEFLISSNSFFVSQKALDNKNFYGALNINDGGIILTMNDITKNQNDENNLMVKGEIYIGDIELDLKSLSLLAPNDKIILSKEETIKAILKIADNKILSGHLDLSDGENIKFVVEEKF